MQSNQNSGPEADAAANGGGERAVPAPEGALTPVLAELAAERRRLRLFLFWSLSLAMAAMTGLIVFFILYMDAAREQAGRSVGAALEESVPEFGRQVGAEIAAVVHSELERNIALQDKLTRIGTENEGLREQQAASGREIQILKQKERDHLRLLDKHRNELKQQRELYQELLERQEAVLAGGNGDADQPGDPASDEETASGEAPAEPGEKVGEMLHALNTLFSQAGLSDLKVAECEKVLESEIYGPTLSYKGFSEGKTAVLMPERLVFIRDGSQVRIVNAGEGTFTPLGEEPRGLAENALNVAFEAAYLEEIDHPRLREFFDLEPLPAVFSYSGEIPGAGDAADGDVLSRLNRLLDEEKGRQYRFAEIGSIDDAMLRNVRFENYDPSGKLKNSVEAGKCWLVIFPRDRYIELRFEDGHILQNKKRNSFYNNRYSLHLVNVDLDMWRKAALDFMIEE